MSEPVAVSETALRPVVRIPDLQCTHCFAPRGPVRGASAVSKGAAMRYWHAVSVFTRGKLGGVKPLSARVIPMCNLVYAKILHVYT